MKSTAIKAVLLAAALSGSSVMALAAETGQGAKPMPNAPGQSNMPMHQGMMGASGSMGDGGMMGMMGMMEMMQSCQKMMGSATMSAGSALPHLPPGNEKLDFQMRAEMMQKIGEIAAKYSDRIKERP